MVKLAVYIASLALGANFSAQPQPPHQRPAAHPSATAVMSHAAVIQAPASGRLVISAAAPKREAVVDGAAATEAEKRLVELVNAERRAKGLNALSDNPLLVQVAREHSREMSEKRYFDHISPTPGLKTPMERYLKSLGRTPGWAYLGENLFYCSIADAERGHRSLMASKTHRDNILNGKFREIGVGVYTAPDGQFYVTQLFLAQTD